MSDHDRLMKLMSDFFVVSEFDGREEKELLDKLSALPDNMTGDIAKLMTVVLDTDWNRVREVLGDNAVKVSFGTLSSLESSGMLMFKMVSLMVVRPLLEKYDAAMRMVETLTVSKEISEAQEEDND